MEDPWVSPASPPESSKQPEQKHGVNGMCLYMCERECMGWIGVCCVLQTSTALARGKYCTSSPWTILLVVHAHYQGPKSWGGFGGQAGGMVGEGDIFALNWRLFSPHQALDLVQKTSCPLCRFSQTLWTYDGLDRLPFYTFAMVHEKLFSKKTLKGTNSCPRLLTDFS